MTTIAQYHQVRDSGVSAARQIGVNRDLIRNQVGVMMNSNHCSFTIGSLYVRYRFTIGGLSLHIIITLMAYYKTRPHNPDPEKYQVVQTKEGWYLKRRRGSGKPAKLNETMQLHAANNCSAETKEVFRALKPYIPRLYGRLQVFFSVHLKKAKMETGRADYRYCEGYEINRLHPLQNIYLENINITEKKGMLYFELPVSEDGIRKKNNLVTEFYFEMILISGDPSIPGSLRSESDRSEMIPYKNIPHNTVKLNLILPAKDIPYLVILKFGCMEGKQNAMHAMHYGVKVVKVG